ncbi:MULTISPECIES: NAD-dependent epimerase/dehydratase family protein [Bradyrhizobium]|uniref:NAD-dependent epimerase/dehydratase family protein n=1 Tax=Bradyrhizobium TaxID=374 RepID=UPI0003FD6CD6|nr:MULTISPECIES: NAD-dependent epimerase/dehydratase family protein [Bradyrhizobium]MBO4225576.1 NAD-dependent epimerase/dehydratase family protein [Bradyrhizobium neotropicale]
MTRILVTGGNGFIGKHLVSALVAQGSDVRVLDLQPPSRALPKVEYVKGSVLDRDLVDSAIDGVDEVYHLAGLPGMWLPRKADFHDVNCGGTEVVIGTACKRGVKRLLHCSTESILFRASRSDDRLADDALLPDDMPGPYTRSKMLAERYAMQQAAAGYPVVIGCPTMPIGTHDHNFTPPTEMLRLFLSQRVQLYLDFVVNLVDVRDVAAGLILAMQRGQFGHRYILGGEGIALKQVLRIMAHVRGRRTPRLAINGRLAEITAGILEFVADRVTHRPPSGTAEGVRIARRAEALSIEKAQRELGYAPGPVEPVLRETIAHLLGSGHNQAEWEPASSPGAQSFNTTRRFGV